MPLPELMQSGALLSAFGLIDWAAVGEYAKTVTENLASERLKPSASFVCMLSVRSPLLALLCTLPALAAHCAHFSDPSTAVRALRAARRSSRRLRMMTGR